MLVTDELLKQLKQYVECYESTVVVAFDAAKDMKEQMSLYVSAKIFLERYS